MLSAMDQPSYLRYYPAELGTRQHRRDNVTMFSGHTIGAYSIMAKFVVTNQFRHRGLNIFRIFACH